MEEAKERELLDDLLYKVWHNVEDPASAFSKEESEELLKRILRESRQDPLEAFPGGNIKRFRWLRVAAAMVGLLGLLSIGIYWLAGPAGEKERLAEILPASDKAVLELADGSRIGLDSIMPGTLAYQGGTRISKTQDGFIRYIVDEPNEGSVDDLLYNTIRTPRGGKYKVVLPDGSTVWLNAGSAIRYPVAFSRHERVVELTGEAYMEIKRYTTGNGSGKRNIPFRVYTGDQMVEVLGTHFNIQGYQDEQFIRTTLIEGAIRVSRIKAGAGESLTLKSGQQCVLNSTGRITLVKEARVEEAIAWREGLFRFSRTPISEVMSQLARWYDVEVRYDDFSPEGHMTGFVPRDVPLSRVIKMLEEITDLQFKLNGRILTVTKTVTDRKDEQ